VCAIAAGLVSFAWPDQYVSSALLRFRPRYLPEQELEWRQMNLIRRLNDIQQEVLSRTSLAQIMQSNIDLYARERRSSPMEDVIQTMRNKDVRVEMVGSPGAFRISFEYPDAHLAQRVVRALVIALIDSNERLNRKR